MSIELFLILLSAFSVISSLVTEAIKKLFGNKKKLSYNIINFVASIFIAGIGTSVYYYLNDIEFTGKNIVCIALMIFASSLTAEVGYDKVKEAILQLVKKED